MHVIAKFRVTDITETQWHKQSDKQTRIKLTAVQGEPFGKATPNGVIEMTIANPEAAKQFKLAQEYYVTFAEDTEE